VLVDTVEHLSVSSDDMHWLLIWQSAQQFNAAKLLSATLSFASVTIVALAHLSADPSQLLSMISLFMVTLCWG